MYGILTQSSITNVLKGTLYFHFVHYLVQRDGRDQYVVPTGTSLMVHGETLCRYLWLMDGRCWQCWLNDFPCFWFWLGASCWSIASFSSLYYRKMTIFNMIQYYSQVSLLDGFAVGTLFIQQVTYSRFPSVQRPGIVLDVYTIFKSWHNPRLMLTVRARP